MSPRIWVVLLAVLLLAAPADAAIAELADAPASICDDEVVTELPDLASEIVQVRSICSVTTEHAVAAPPLLGRIFRPPRALVD